MEEKKISRLKRELKLKEFQFNSIFEFSEFIYSSFHIDNIVRVYFSTLMTQLGVSRVLLCDEENLLFHRRGFTASTKEKDDFRHAVKKLGSDWFSMTSDQLGEEHAELKAFMDTKKIVYLVNISESRRQTAVMGMGARLNGKDLCNEHIEYAYFVSKFSLSAIDNALLIDKLIETKRMEHELKIASDIQLSLLPQSVPELENFEISVVYMPIHEVGGDYYDILKKRNEGLPILIADVEGKGLPAALLATSSQAIFRSLNELYLFESGKFIAKANKMICEFTGGTRFITLFWMLVNDAAREITYVNAGHIEPVLISGDNVRSLNKGGFLTGFIDTAEYEKETVPLKSGDIIVAFTDGVPEVENRAGDEYGLERVIEFVKANRHLSAKAMTESLYQDTLDFSEKTKFRDDFTLIILKAK